MPKKLQPGQQVRMATRTVGFTASKHGGKILREAFVLQRTLKEYVLNPIYDTYKILLNNKISKGLNSSSLLAPAENFDQAALIRIQ